MDVGATFNCVADFPVLNHSFMVNIQPSLKIPRLGLVKYLSDLQICLFSFQNLTVFQTRGLRSSRGNFEFDSLFVACDNFDRHSPSEGSLILFNPFSIFFHLLRNFQTIPYLNKITNKSNQFNENI